MHDQSIAMKIPLRPNWLPNMTPTQASLWGGLALVGALAFFFAGVNVDGFMETRQPSSCPDPESIQSSFVKDAYVETNHVGLYHELAFKDITQPRICKCITSNKYLLSPDVLQDDFNIECGGRVYHSDLSFDLNVDERRGYMIGR